MDDIDETFATIQQSNAAEAAAHNHIARLKAEVATIRKKLDASVAEATQLQSDLADSQALSAKRLTALHICQESLDHKTTEAEQLTEALQHSHEELAKLRRPNSAPSAA